MKKYGRILCAILGSALFLTTALPVTAAQPTIDFDQKGSITIELKDMEEGETLSGIAFTLYRVADIKDEAVLSYSYTPDFAECWVNADEIFTGDVAPHFAYYAKENDVIGITQRTDGSKLTFSDLELGLYVAVENGTVKGYYPVTPFLVSVPMTNSKGTAWIYDIDAGPKVEAKPLPPGPLDRRLTVRKVWAGAGNNIPEKVEVQLLKNGEYDHTATLSNENDWEYTWYDLDYDYQWSVVEKDVPKGFEVSYSTGDRVVTITNTATSDVPKYPVNLTVRKVWDDNGLNRPTSVTVCLYKNGRAGETVTLSEDNNWMYTWHDLSPDSKWDVKESAVPKGYSPYYSRTGNLITVTNSTTLIRTGQLVWPIPLLACSGMVFLTVGMGLMKSKRKKDEE